nr:MAG TPA: metallothionein-1 [Caudoviricetes sp.]
MKTGCKCQGCKRNGWQGFQPCASRSSWQVLPPPKQP